MKAQPIVDAPRTAATGEVRGETADPNSVAKATATLQARLALRGFELRELPSGGYIASRWNHARDLADLPAVERFCQLVGA